MTPMTKNTNHLILPALSTALENNIDKVGSFFQEQPDSYLALSLNPVAPISCVGESGHTCDFIKVLIKYVEMAILLHKVSDAESLDKVLPIARAISIEDVKNNPMVNGDTIVNALENTTIEMECLDDNFANVKIEMGPHKLCNTNISLVPYSKGVCRPYIATNSQRILVKELNTFACGRVGDTAYIDRGAGNQYLEVPYVDYEQSTQNAESDNTLRNLIYQLITYGEDRTYHCYFTVMLSPALPEHLLEILLNKTLRNGIKAMNFKSGVTEMSITPLPMSEGSNYRFATCSANGTDIVIEVSALNSWLLSPAPVIHMDNTPYPNLFKGNSL